MRRFSRRSFIRSGLAWGGAAFVGYQFFPRFLKASPPPLDPDILVSPGDDPAFAVRRLLEALGGADKFVQRGKTVGILVNSPWINPGYFTNPDVALGVVKQCMEAGAKEIVCFKPVPDGYWEKSSYYEEMKDIIAGFRYGSSRITVPVPKGLSLKEAEIFTDFNDVDVFISIPVAKHHNGINFSGVLKGMMGVSSSDTNRHMHSPDGEYTYAKQEYLSQCVADLNLLRKPDLCVVDALECALNNCPRGPGETLKPNKILAGIDPVAMDAYAASLLDFDLNDIPSIRMAADHGLGKARLDEIVVEEI